MPAGLRRKPSGAADGIRLGCCRGLCLDLQPDKSFANPTPVAGDVDWLRVSNPEGNQHRHRAISRSYGYPDRFRDSLSLVQDVGVIYAGCDSLRRYVPLQLGCHVHAEPLA